MFRKLLVPVFAFSVVVTVSAMPQQPQQQAPRQVTVWVPHAIAPEKIDADMYKKIRAEGMDHSKIMWIEHYLTDVYGPRPTGSPNQAAAANWAVKTMTSFGLKNAHLEPFTWRGIGWLPGLASGYITSPMKANLKFEAVPWSPSTNGTVKGDVVCLVPPETPTQAELTAYLVKMAPMVKGAIVMVGAPPAVPVEFNERAKRIPDDQVKARYEPGASNRPRFLRARGGGQTPAAGHLSARQVNEQIAQMLRDNLPALRLQAQGPGRIPGVIVAQNGPGQIYDDKTPQSPAVILRTDDYGRIFRIIADGTPVSVEFNVQNQYFPDGKTSYVTVAEIPGTDKADEVVMLGGHLDSWASATGATDNAIGSAVMMEAARILEAVGAKPRRTIRVALWSGEEQGLLGSLDYVKRHFGSAEKPLPDYAKLDAYWNIDDGTGRVRGATVFGPPEAAAVVAQYLAPFEDWGVFGAAPSSARVEGGSDNGAFAVAGLPGIGAQQDPIEYNSTTWHTDLDTYERIVPDDVMKNAVITASVVLGLADRDAMLPRFSGEDMPEIPQPRRFGNQAGPTSESRVFVVDRNKPFTVAPPGLQPPPNPRAETKTAATVALDAAPAHGKVMVKEDGSFVYTPARNFTGTDTFTYKVTNGTETIPGTATVIVK
ncbi:MAG TPA: M20/M25/M40 family metallo-hydrolase [Vicinamibacterales bacterium]|nr:M20/M25/M40 family metallo-hydrolase [Vicinamibacterales bacterium]